MDPVVGRGDQDIFEPTHFVDQFSMHKDPPDLGCGVYEYDIQWFEAEEGQRDEVHEPVKGLEDGGAESYRKVHFF